MILVAAPATSVFDCVRFNPMTGSGAFEALPAISIFDCVRFNLFGVFADDSALSRPALGGERFGDASAGLKRFAAARKADGWFAIESIFLN